MTTARLMKIAEAANYLNCHQMMVRKMISRREIPHIKKSGIGIRLRKEDLDAWLESDLRLPDGWNIGV